VCGVGVGVGFVIVCWGWGRAAVSVFIIWTWYLGIRCLWFNKKCSFGLEPGGVSEAFAPSPPSHQGAHRRPNPKPVPLPSDAPPLLPRLFKLPGLLEDHCEEYGQTATYMGTIPGQEDACEWRP